MGEELASSVQEVMMEEWENLRTEHAHLPTFPGPSSHPGGRGSLKRRASFPECSTGGSSMAKRANRDPALTSDDESLVGGSLQSYDCIHVSCRIQ